MPSINKERKESPKRSLLFIAFNAEELGLLGARHYTLNPLFPLDKTKLINFDGVGPIDANPVGVLTVEGKQNEMQSDLILASKELGIVAVAG